MKLTGWIANTMPLPMKRKRTTMSSIIMTNEWMMIMWSKWETGHRDRERVFVFGF